MTAPIKVIIARTGLTDTEARSYLQQAEDRVRLYLAYQEDEDLSPFSSVLADIACSLYDKQEAVNTAQQAWIQSAGLNSKSYSEGPVSVSETYATYGGGGAGAVVAKSYEEQIQGQLNTIARFRRVRVVKC